MLRGRVCEESLDDALPTLANLARIIMYKGVGDDDDDDGAGVSDGDGDGGGGSPLKIRLNINELSLPTAQPPSFGHSRSPQTVAERRRMCRKVCWCEMNASRKDGRPSVETIVSFDHGLQLRDHITAGYKYRKMI